MAKSLPRNDLSELVDPDAAGHLRDFLLEAHRQLPNRIVRIVLFGSRARGEARQGSDYDVAVFVRKLVDQRRVRHLLADIAYPHILAGVHIRPVVVPERYLEASDSGLLAREIANDGIMLIDA